VHVRHLGERRPGARLAFRDEVRAHLRVVAAELAEQVLHVRGQLVEGVLVHGERAGEHGAEVDLRDVRRDLVQLEGQHTGDQDDRAVGHAGLQHVVEHRQAGVDRDGTRAVNTAGDRARREELLAPDVLQALHRELGDQVVGIRHLRPEVDRVVLGPLGGERGHLLHEPVLHLDQRAEVAGHEGRVVRGILQRLLGRLPKRPDPADVGQAVTDAFKGVVEVVQRAPVRLGPLDGVGRPARLEALVRLRHDQLLQRDGPGQHRRVARADGHPVVTRRRGHRGQQGKRHCAKKLHLSSLSTMEKRSSAARHSASGRPSSFRTRLVPCTIDTVL
jgi:hypothetical protein